MAEGSRNFNWEELKDKQSEELKTGKLSGIGRYALYRWFYDECLGDEESEFWQIWKPNGGEKKDDILLFFRLLYIAWDGLDNISFDRFASSPLYSETRKKRNWSLSNEEISILRGIIEKYDETFLSATAREHYLRRNFNIEEKPFKKVIEEEIKYFDNHIAMVLDKIDERVLQLNENRLAGSASKYVFVSHAYFDRPYILALYFYLKHFKVESYIDWMYNAKFNRVIDIRNNLHKGISNSSQFLFVPHIYQLAIGLPLTIRPWCVWEMGNFHNDATATDNSYYLELFGGYSGCKLLEGYKTVQGIRSGELI